MPDPSPFSDIGGHWAEGAIRALAARGLVSGYPDGRFRPDHLLARAEMAALIARVFADAPAVREAPSHADVPDDHWAAVAIRWAGARGFFSGYPDGSFRPVARLSRLQAVLVLVGGLGLAPEATTIDPLATALEDADRIPAWAAPALTAALQARLLVNHPQVRRLRPHDPASRAEVVAMAARALAIEDAVPAAAIAWRFQLRDIPADAAVPLAELDRHESLVREIQAHLHEFRLYPGGARIDGAFGPRSRAALLAFAEAAGLALGGGDRLDRTAALRLLQEEPVAFVLAGAADRQRVHAEYLRQEEGFDSLHLAFLDRGVGGSRFGAERGSFPDRLRERPDGVEVIGMEAAIGSAGGEPGFSPFPPRGQLPPVLEGGLEFLHADIRQACVCVAGLGNGPLRARWLGRRALDNVQCWSATKVIPLLALISQANARFPGIDIDQTLVRPRGGGPGHGFHDLAVDVIGYGSAIGSSNALAAMLKRFRSPAGLQGWLRDLTGHRDLLFQGRYGESPHFLQPELLDRRSGRVLLGSAGPPHSGPNLISVYDVTRCLAMLGWHHHLPPQHRLPGAQWDSLESLVRAMGGDTARHLDVALERLNLSRAIRSVVILSKLGFGRSGERNRTELVYSALLQFVDKRRWRAGQPAVIGGLAMTLLGASDAGDADQEARAVDARMAAEVTEILRRLLGFGLV